MNFKASLLMIALGAVAIAPLTGCDSGTNAPPAAAMAPRNDPPTKIPTTVDEKIQAIQNAPMPEEQKKREIEKVRSGKL